jgi:hypothetical protein
MATKAEIKKVILEIAGNPESGVIAQLADKWAEAIVSLDSAEPYVPEAKDGDGDGVVQEGTPFERQAKEVRVIKAKESR